MFLHTLLCLSLLGLQCGQGKESPPTGHPDLDDFLAKIAKGKDVYVEDRQISQELDFTALVNAYTMAPGSRRATIGGAVTFYKCRFRGPVTAYRSEKDGVNVAVNFAKNLTFIDCVFDEAVNFRASNVQDLACFLNCTFSKKANFEEGDFNNYAIFSNSKFNSDTRFQNAFFRKKADFFKTEFSEAVNFQGASFALEAQFNAAKSFTSADFSTAVFQGHAFFNYAELHGKTSFTDAWFKGRCEFNKAKFVEVTLKRCRFFDRPRFEETIIDISLDLDACSWAGGRPELGKLDRKKVLNYAD